MESVMRWLSRAWHSGELTDEEWNESNAAYERHLRDVLPRLPEGLRQLNGEPSNDGAHLTLHDSRVVQCEWDLPDRLTLKVRGWDSRDRAQLMTLTYSGTVEVGGASPEVIAVWFADDRTEFIYQEVDVLEDGRCEHRHLLWPEGEFAVRFEEIELHALADAPRRT